MILVLNILSIEKGTWLVVKNDQILFSHDFKINRGEDKSLLELQKLLQDNKLKLENFSGFILLVKDASMTQVKIFTITANTLAWQFDWPILADYYFKEDNEKILIKILKKLAKIKKFKAVIPKYSRKVDISISKKQSKYKISK
ncbi:MAG: hypothetical protein WCS88_04270 [Patescibacteria group bacterium]|jgi:hypothetical protein